jgi:NAD(P)-dependent dehydrogenase (short-subunit alcohol dehydrogenase family)
MAVTYDYAGKTAIVTGGGTGIGFAIAEELARAGATVTLMGHRVDQIEPAAKKLIAAFGAKAIRSSIGDVTQEADMKRAVETACGADGSLDFAIANAGGGAPGPIMLLPKEVWDEVLALNVTGTALLIKYAGLAMRQKGGRIVTISSSAAYQPVKYMSPYSTAKAAVEMLTKSAAIELGPFGINVNCIAPGWIKSEAGLMVGPDLEKQMTERTALGDGAPPQVIAHGVLHLCSSHSSFTTGAIVETGGGMHLYGGEDFTSICLAVYGEAVKPLMAPSQMVRPG